MDIPPVPFQLVMSPPYIMKPLIILWKTFPLYDKPSSPSPVHRQRKFSAVLGTLVLNSSKTTLFDSVSPILISMQTYGLFTSNAGSDFSSFVIPVSFSLYSPYENSDLAAFDYTSFVFLRRSFIFSNSSLKDLSYGFSLMASFMSERASSYK